LAQSYRVAEAGGWVSTRRDALNYTRDAAGGEAAMTGSVSTPDTCQHLPVILERRGVPVAPAMEVLSSLAGLIQTVESDTYARFEALARQRIDRRDEDDWPVLASALALGCPV
jgi:PIN domain